MESEAEEIGRRWIRSNRKREETPDHGDPRDPELDDETVWAALVGALDEARGDTELFLVADLLVTEVIMTRAALNDRLPGLCRTNPAAREMARMMADPVRSPWGTDPLGNRAFWSSIVLAPHPPSVTYRRLRGELADRLSQLASDRTEGFQPLVIGDFAGRPPIVDGPQSTTEVTQMLVDFRSEDTRPVIKCNAKAAVVEEPAHAFGE